jgi:hypothetical protein
MDELFAWIAEVPKRPLGTVLHVGAGNGPVVDAYAALGPQRVVLVEGDAESAAALRLAAAPHRWAEVVECVLAPASGEAAWQRFDLPRFNGLHVPARLAWHYPRLRALGMQTVPTTAIASLELLQQPASDGATDLLVLDVPGQEVALLAALAPGRLQRFAWLAVRACALDDDGEGATAARVAEAAQRHGYRPVRRRGEVDPAWPLAFFELDPVRLRIERLRARTATLEAALAQSRQAEARWRGEHGALDGQFRRLQREMERFVVERDQLAEASVKDKAQLRAERDGLAEQRTALGTEREALRAQVAERDRQLADRDRLLAERDAEIARLSAGGRATDLAHLRLQEELARAEGQLEMLKGLLLGPPSR